MSTEAVSGKAPGGSLADEFSSWTMSPEQAGACSQIRLALDQAMSIVLDKMPDRNVRYKAIVRTKFEELGFFAIKGVAKP